MLTFWKETCLFIVLFFSPKEKNMGNIKKVYACFSLTIENIGFIYLTKHIIKLKVNVLCRISLVFKSGIGFKIKELRTFLGGKARYVLRGEGF